MARLRRRYRHAFLGDTIDISDNRVLPGMVVTFYYNAIGVYDRNPSCLVMHADKNFLYGFNINYLPINQIKDILRRINVVLDFVTENKVQAPRPYNRIEMATKFTPSPFDGKSLYRNLSVNPKANAAYRTYKQLNLSALKVLNIDFASLGFTLVDKSEDDPK